MKSGKVNADLIRERQNCPFVKEELTNLLDGSLEDTAKRREIEEFFLKSNVRKDKTEYMHKRTSG